MEACCFSLERPQRMDAMSGSAISYSSVYWGVRNAGLAASLGAGPGLRADLKEGFMIHRILWRNISNEDFSKVYTLSSLGIW